MRTLDFLKDVDRTIAVGSRRVVITFSEDVPEFYNGILSGDYLAFNRKKGWYCSASVVRPEELSGIFINDKGDYIPLRTWSDAPCAKKDVKLHNMPSLQQFREIEAVRQIIDNSLSAVGLEKLPADMSAAFWSCDDRFFNKKKRPLLIKKYRKLQEKYLLPEMPFMNITGEVIRELPDISGQMVDLLQEFNLLLVRKDGQGQCWILHEDSPSVFYVLNKTIAIIDAPQNGDFERLMSIKEVKKNIPQPQDELQDLLFTYEDGSQYEKPQQRKLLGIPFTFRDGARAIVNPCPFLCFDFEKYKAFCDSLPQYQNKKWSFAKREHLVELAHNEAFRRMQNELDIDLIFSGEWAFSQVVEGDIAEAWMVPVVSPDYWDVDKAYKNVNRPAHTMTTLNDCIHVMFVMYL